MSSTGFILVNRKIVLRRSVSEHYHSSNGHFRLPVFEKQEEEIAHECTNGHFISLKNHRNDCSTFVSPLRCITITRSSEFKFDLQQRTSSMIASARFRLHLAKDTANTLRSRRAGIDNNLSLSRISVGIRFGTKTLIRLAKTRRSESSVNLVKLIRRPSGVF